MDGNRLVICCDRLLPQAFAIPSTAGRSLGRRSVGGRWAGGAWAGGVW